MTSRRSSYTGEDSLYTAGASSQSSAYRRLSQYVFSNFTQKSFFLHTPFLFFHSFLFDLYPWRDKLHLSGLSQTRGDCLAHLMAVPTPPFPLALIM